MNIEDYILKNLISTVEGYIQLFPINNTDGFYF